MGEMIETLERDEGLLADPEAMARKGKAYRPPRTVGARTLEKLRRDGAMCATVRLWIPGQHARRRLWGFAEVLAIRDGCAVLIRPCKDADLADTFRAVCEEPRVRAVLEAEVAVEIWAWGVVDDGRKLKKPRWSVKVEEVLEGDLVP